MQHLHSAPGDYYVQVIFYKSFYRALHSTSAQEFYKKFDHAEPFRSNSVKIESQNNFTHPLTYRFPSDSTSAKAPLVLPVVLLSARLCCGNNQRNPAAGHVSPSFRIPTRAKPR